MNTNQIAHIAGLVGEPARTAMLMALMDGRALTARELADAGHITAQTASRHLALLVEAGLLRLERQGRHRYHRLASADVARVLEGLMQLAVQQPAPQAAARRVVVGPRDAALRTARTCYDHIAGRLGIAITEHLLDEGAMAFDGDAGGHVTAQAAPVLQRLGIDAAAHAAGGGKRPHCRPCLDWSERRMHVAGKLGAMICSHCLAEGWLLRRADSRALEITPGGAVALRNWLGHARWNAVASP
ncbi:DNA-binding transcriptional ArsR family regulator [Acidovorax soli]|uniref:DNA-binding transcriptional ArsR family regulator n=1 Tax=Acidovorax soli TaxID=592050 RepID=A0A7X0PM28_9BURK|nr:MarR family transcriptional regulator [Acidovorax soli]MBB6563916.1 DNA-binding transcriptional ArsR family regulator [Acidovorax soli]